VDFVENWQQFSSIGPQYPESGFDNGLAGNISDICHKIETKESTLPS
jgi:hypothetical protein